MAPCEGRTPPTTGSRPGPPRTMPTRRPRPCGKVGLHRGMPAMQSPGLAARAYVDDAPLAARPTSARISVPYPRGAAGYTYDRKGKPLSPFRGGEGPDRCRRRQARDRQERGRPVHAQVDRPAFRARARPDRARSRIGSGPALVFREGRSWKATWRKASVGDLTRLFDAAGTEIPLVRGRTFFQVVPTGTKISAQLDPLAEVRTERVVRRCRLLPCA